MADLYMAIFSKNRQIWSHIKLSTKVNDNFFPSAFYISCWLLNHVKKLYRKVCMYNHHLDIITLRNIILRDHQCLMLNLFRGVRIECCDAALILCFFAIWRVILQFEINPYDTLYNVFSKGHAVTLSFECFDYIM